MPGRLSRLSALSVLTTVGAIVAAAALVAITAMTAWAGVPPNLAKAIEAQKHLAAERPDDPAVFNDLGNLLVLARQPDAAESAYRRSTELDPKRVSALFNLGLLLQQGGNLHEAKALYEKVLAAEPQHAWAHYQLGTYFEAKGENSRAVREYAAAFALDPQIAFRDVNPQIVDNKLVTESMLRAYQRQSSAAEAPAVYDDPNRIRDLLLPQQKPKDAAEAPPAATNGQHPPVLRPKDLPTGNVGQASTPGGPNATPNRPGSPARVPVSPYSAASPANANGGASASRNWARPNPAPSNGLQPGVVVTPPPNGIYYQPGTSSTGQLGSQVIPERNG